MFCEHEHNGDSRLFILLTLLETILVILGPYKLAFWLSTIVPLGDFWHFLESHKSSEVSVSWISGNKLIFSSINLLYLSPQNASQCFDWVVTTIFIGWTILRALLWFACITTAECDVSLAKMRQSAKHQLNVSYQTFFCPQKWSN